MGLALLSLALSSCAFGFNTRTTGAETIEELQAEDAYKSVYAQWVQRFHEDVLEIMPPADGPGPCQAGGTKQLCYDAGLRLMSTLRQMYIALDKQPVPPRYVEGDRLLKEGLAKNVEAIQLRNRGIAENDNESFQAHKSVMDEAIHLYEEAYDAFPADNRPAPKP